MQERKVSLLLHSKHEFWLAVQIRYTLKNALQFGLSRWNASRAWFQISQNFGLACEAKKKKETGRFYKPGWHPKTYAMSLMSNGWLNGHSTDPNKALVIDK